MVSYQVYFMLDVNLKNQLKIYFVNVSKDVELVVFVDDFKVFGEMLVLLNDIVFLIDKVIVKEVCDDVECKFFFSINCFNENLLVCFVGLFMGYEFILLVLVLLYVGGYLLKEEQVVFE